MFSWFTNSADCGLRWQLLMECFTKAKEQRAGGGKGGQGQGKDGPSGKGQGHDGGKRRAFRFPRPSSLQASLQLVSPVLLLQPTLSHFLSSPRSSKMILPGPWAVATASPVDHRPLVCNIALMRVLLQVVKTATSRWHKSRVIRRNAYF